MIKIKDAVERVMQQFGNVDEGDTFRYEGYVYIRVKLVEDNEGDTWNAVCLTNGQFAYFHGTDLVEPIEIEATILKGKS